uniref:Glutathione peroxidase 7 n=1 Tax=Equus caballus TaxID=9796 RepID=A0A9L0T8Q6_HORSE
MVAALVAAWLLLAVAAGAQREQDFYDFKAVNIRGKLVSLEKYRGSVSVRPRGLGAALAGPDGGAPRPGTLPGMAPRGLGPPGNPALAPPSSVPGIPPRRGAPRSCAGLARDYVAQPPRSVKPETLAAGADFPPSDFGLRGRTSPRGWMPRPSLCHAWVGIGTLASCGLCLSCP